MSPILFHRHYPSWATGFPDLSTTASTMEEMLSIPWVRSWTEAPNFVRFSISLASLDGEVYHNLMCELDGGASWWVLAHLDGRPDWLPIWDGEDAMCKRRAKDAARPAPPPLTRKQRAERRKYSKMAADAWDAQIEKLRPVLTPDDCLPKEPR